jgi:hypothetical protein
VQSGAPREALELARRYARRAQAALTALPAGPVRGSLTNLADHVLERH